MELEGINRGGRRGVLIGCPMPNSEVLTSASRELGNAKTVQVGPFAVSGRARGRILAKTFDPLVLPTPSLFQSSCSSPVQSAFPLTDTVRIALVILPRPLPSFPAVPPREASLSLLLAQIAMHSSRVRPIDSIPPKESRLVL